jgi:signal-transduction protein with cAMP-binding, CBS, and nucleotidyltransferase domain
MKTGQACNRNTVYIGADASAVDAARLMRKHHVGDLVITQPHADSRTPIGIITNRDLVLEVIATEIDRDAVTVADLFASDRLFTASVDDELEDTIEEMKRRGVRRMPVLERDGSLAGILTMDDVLALISDQLSAIVRLVSHQQNIESNRRV